jgi:hypothetical protein
VYVVLGDIELGRYHVRDVVLQKNMIDVLRFRNLMHGGALHQRGVQHTLPSTSSWNKHIEGSTIIHSALNPSVLGGTGGREQI